MTHLSININKFATLRNARGGNLPDILEAAKNCVSYGAQGITVHPRPDERHIRQTDIYDLSRELTVEFNIEGYPSEEFLSMIEIVKPTQCTLVPDPPDVLTSNAGWDTCANCEFLENIVLRLKDAGVRTSLFVEPELAMIEGAKRIGTDRVELYTEEYAQHFETDKKEAISPYIEAARCANELGMGINAGHDLNLQNLTYFKDNIDGLLEVSIGHALICDAIYLGLQNTINAYQACLGNAAK